MREAVGEAVREGAQGTAVDRAAAGEPSRPAATRRGALLIGAAKAWFLVAGLGQSILVPWAIGQGGFGAFKRAQAFVNVLNNVVVVASIQAVSRAVASAPESSRRATMRSATAVHGVVGLALGALFLAAVPAIVAYQRAPHLAWPLRTLALVIVAYSVYAPLVGALNGVRAFGAQAALDAAYSTGRAVLTATFGVLFVRAALGDGVLGASIGFAATAVTIVPIAWLAARRIRDDRASGEIAAFDVRAHLSVLSGLLAVQAFQSLALQIDLVVLGRAATLRGVAVGLDEPAARALADRVAGLYAQAQAFGLVPYQLLVAAGFVLFPSVAAARARGDTGAVQRDVASGGAATLLVAGAIVSAIAGTPAAVLRFAYGRGAVDALPLVLAEPVLRTLAIAHGATAVATLGTTLVAAAGRARLAAVLAAVLAIATLAATSIATARPVAPEALAHHAALGLACGIFVAAAIVAVAVARVLGPFVRIGHVARVAVGVAAAVAVGARVPVPGSRILAPLAALIPLVVYVAVVALLGARLSLRRGAAGPGGAGGA